MDPKKSISSNNRVNGPLTYRNIRHNSADSVPTSFVTTRSIPHLHVTRLYQDGFIMNFQSCDLKHGSTFSNHCEVIILSTKSLARYKYQFKIVVYKILLIEIDFQRLFDGLGLLKVMFYCEDDRGGRSRSYEKCYHSLRIICHA